MSHTPDLNDCAATQDGASTLTPVSPYLGIHYHFGMLLGVDDFETEQAYHRGKSRLHNAWLHRDGVVWGLEVKLDTAKGEVRVLPGFALDGAGRELHLEADACVNLGAWFEQHRGDSGFAVTESSGKFTFDAHVVAAFRACLTRQVPALTQPCEGSGADTAYSRVFETIELKLVPGPAPAPTPPLSHALRLLFDLDVATVLEDSSIDPGDQEILDARAAVFAKPLAEQRQAWLELFRHLAAADEMHYLPAVDPETNETLLFPAPDSVPIVLAEITGLVLEKQTAGWVASAGEVRNQVRPAHVPTRAIQELLCVNLMRGPTQLIDAGGPRVDRTSVSFSGTTVIFKVDRDLHQQSVKPSGFSVSSFDTASGWQVATISNATYDATAKTTTLTLSAAIGGTLQRLIAYGTGPQPVLSVDLLPLAGAINDPPAAAHNGRDFVFMKTVA